MARSKKEVADAYNLPFPIALRTLMREKAITQENIAEATGKTRQTVSQYVNGISEPGYDTLIKIADYFDVSVDYLLGRTKDRRKNPSIYDGIGLSEESITILRVAQESVNGVINHQKLEKLLPSKEELAAKFNFGVTDPAILEQNINTMWEMMSKGVCGELAKYLPEFIDRVIEVAIDTPIVIESFSQIINPDRQPKGLDKVMSQDEFVRFKVFEITNYLSTRLLDWFEDYRKEFYGFS